MKRCELMKGERGKEGREKEIKNGEKIGEERKKESFLSGAKKKTKANILGVEEERKKRGKKGGGGGERREAC